MNTYLSIANNILTGSLRPWSNENQDEEKFRHLLNQKLRQYKENPSSFCRATVKAIDELKIKTENENIEELKELATVEVEKPVVFEIPQFFNKQTEFYSYLIKNTFQCLISGIIEILNSTDDVDSTYKLYQIFNKLEELISISKGVQPEDKSSSMILDILKLNLFITHSILQQRYNQNINFEVLSESEILYQLSPDFESETRDKFKLAYYLNQYISERDKASDEPIQVVNSKPEPERTSYDSFKYVYYDTKYDNLTNLCDSLKKNKFIADETDSRVFKKVFSGKEITKPIVWTGNPSEFAYFIKLIYVIHNYVDDLKQKQWEIACKCFVQSDGSPFDRSKLRTLKKPQLSYKKLEVVVDNLK